MLKLKARVMNRTGGRWQAITRRGCHSNAAKKTGAEKLPGTAWYWGKKGGKDPSQVDDGVGVARKTTAKRGGDWG